MEKYQRANVVNTFFFCTHSAFFRLERRQNAISALQAIPPKLKSISLLPNKEKLKTMTLFPQRYIFTSRTIVGVLGWVLYRSQNERSQQCCLIIEYLNDVFFCGKKCVDEKKIRKSLGVLWKHVHEYFIPALVALPICPEQKKRKLLEMEKKNIKQHDN